MTNPDRTIEAVARRQFGAFDTTQARQAGLTNRMVGVRVRSGAWARRARGVYVITAVSSSWKQRLMCAVLNHNGSAVCGRAAAALYEMAGFRPGRPELVVPATGAHRSPLARLHRSADVELTTVGPIPAVTPVQALFDVAGTVPLRMLRRATEDAILRGIVDPDHLAARFDHFAPCYNEGIGDMRSVVDVVCGRGRIPPASELEALALELFDELGVQVSRQHSFSWRAPVSMITDGVAEDLRLIVEADSRTWHARVEAITTDRKRDIAALAHGYETTRLTHEMLTVDRAATKAELVTYIELRRATLAALHAQGFVLPA